MQTEDQQPKSDGLEEKLRGLIASGVLPERDVADALSRWIHAVISATPDRKVPPLIEAGILAAFAQAFSEANGARAIFEQASPPKHCTTVRLGAAMRIVGAMLDGDIGAIDAIWDEANASALPRARVGEEVQGG